MSKLPSPTDADFRKQRDRIRKLADKWLTVLGLKWWSIDIEYSRVPLETDAGAEWVCTAKASAKWEYLRGTLSFNVIELISKPDEELERIFVHECCHLLVNEMRMWGEKRMSERECDEAMHHEERVVCGMTSAFLWTFKAGVDAAKATRKRAKK